MTHRLLTLRYRHHGRVCEWRGEPPANGTDEQALREWLAYWMPEAEYVSGEVVELEAQNQ